MNGKSITINLNGFTLTVNNAAGVGLTVTNSGEVLLTGEVAGTAEFNVTGSTYGVRASGSSKAAVSNATGGDQGVYASDTDSTLVSGTIVAGATSNEQ